MAVQLNGDTFEGYQLTIVDAEREYTPLLVSEVSKIESSGVNAGVVEKRTYGSNNKFLEIDRDGHGDRYEIRGLVDKTGRGLLRNEVGVEGNVVSVLCEEVDFIDDDFTVRDLTVFVDEALQDDSNSPIYFFKLVLKEQ